MPTTEEEPTDLEEFDGFGMISESELPPTLEPEPESQSPQEMAEKAVKNALLENRVWTDAGGRDHKIHNVSDAHALVWNEIISDGRSNAFQVVSLLWVLLQSPKRILKLGALNIVSLRAEVLKFMTKESIKGARFEELEDCLATMLEETQAVQVAPVPPEGDEGK